MLSLTRNKTKVPVLSVEIYFPINDWLLGKWHTSSVYKSYTAWEPLCVHYSTDLPSPSLIWLWDPLMLDRNQCFYNMLGVENNCSNCEASKHLYTHYWWAISSSTKTSQGDADLPGWMELWTCQVVWKDRVVLKVVHKHVKPLPCCPKCWPKLSISENWKLFNKKMIISVSPYMVLSTMRGRGESIKLQKLFSCFVVIIIVSNEHC